MNQTVSIRDSFIQAFLSLIKQMPLSSLTVVALIKEADVSHQSFYRHFTDKYQLAETICYDNFKLFTTIYGENASWKEVITCMLNIIKNNPSFYRKLLSDKEGSTVLIKSILSIFSEHSGCSISIYSVNSWLLIIKDWSYKNFSVPVDEIYTRLLHNMSISDIMQGDDLTQTTTCYENLRLSEL
ncbi:MAG: TetR/AcrR family transcriptional regulator [Lachnospiraceae bacterium]